MSSGQNGLEKQKPLSLPDIFRDPQMHLENPKDVYHKTKSKR